MANGVQIKESYLTQSEINDSDLRVFNAVKQSNLCKILWFLKVINLQGSFEGLKDDFSQSKPKIKEHNKLHYVSTIQIK